MHLSISVILYLNEGKKMKEVILKCFSITLVLLVH